jgi:hypothetical protein
MSKHTFIDVYGEERPMPPEQDNDEAQYQRGFVGGSWWEDSSSAAQQAELDEGLLHDLKCEAFKRGWEAGKLHMATCQREAEKRFGEYEH